MNIVVRGGLALSVLMLAACGGGGGGGGGGENGKADQQALIAEIEQLFPFTPNQPLDQLFVCGIQGSNLTWYFDFLPNGSIQITTTLDTGDNVAAVGSYTYQNDEIVVQGDGVLVLLANETSTSIQVAMGMISVFTSPNLVCATGGHRYNATEFNSLVHYECPTSNIQAATQDENTIEFVHSAVPFSNPVAGSAFRQRDRLIVSNPNANIVRGYGIYRRSGNRFFVFFDGNQFDDFDYLSGNFTNGDATIVLDQTIVASGPCNAV